MKLALISTHVSIGYRQVPSFWSLGAETLLGSYLDFRWIFSHMGLSCLPQVNSLALPLVCGTSVGDS